ncbi:MAG: hypothetical protein ACFCVH_14000 [Alphaproteobacteria bacterium]
MADRNPADPIADSEASAAAADGRPALAKPDRWHFCHLPFAYQMLIWATRMWNNEHVQPAQRWSTIRQAFAKVNAEDATLPFLRLMEVIQTGASMPILVGEGGCTVFADEIRLAEIVAGAVRGDPEASTARLQRMLAPGAARVAQSLVRELAAELKLSGLNFTRVGVLDKQIPDRGDASVH